MVWFAWVLVAVCALNAAANVLYIGKDREPITPGNALAICVVNGLIAWAVIALAT